MEASQRTLGSILVTTQPKQLGWGLSCCRNTHRSLLTMSASSKWIQRNVEIWISFILSILTIMPPHTTCDDLYQGHDVNILEDMLSHTWRPPILWVEWFWGNKMISYDRSGKWGVPEAQKRSYIFCNMSCILSLNPFLFRILKSVAKSLSDCLQQQESLDMKYSNQHCRWERKNLAKTSITLMTSCSYTRMFLTLWKKKKQNLSF